MQEEDGISRTFKTLEGMLAISRRGLVGYVNGRCQAATTEITFVHGKEVDVSVFWGPKRHAGTLDIVMKRSLFKLDDGFRAQMSGRRASKVL
jgi:hypothetical protein